MDSGLWQRLDALARRLFPFSAGLLLAALGAVPVHLPGFGAVAPMLPLIAVYYWAIFRPELLPAPAVAALGLFQDVLAGTPLGLNAFLYLMAFAVVLNQRRFFLGKSFLVMWFGFFLIAGGVTATAWILISFLDGVIVSPAPALFQCLVTLAFFPLLTRVFVRTQQALLRQV